MSDSRKTASDSVSMENSMGISQKCKNGISM